MGIIFCYSIPDNINGESRHKFFSNFKNIIQFIDGKVGSIDIPIKTIVFYSLLKSIELSLVIKDLFKMLCQSKIELIITSESIELAPEHIKKYLLLITTYIMYRSNIEKNSINICRFQP